MELSSREQHKNNLVSAVSRSPYSKVIGDLPAPAISSPSSSSSAGPRQEHPNLAVCLTPPQPITSTQDLSSSSSPPEGASLGDPEVYSATQTLVPGREVPLPLTPSELAEIENAQRVAAVGGPTSSHSIRHTPLRHSSPPEQNTIDLLSPLTDPRLLHQVVADSDRGGLAPQPIDSLSIIPSGNFDSSRHSESRPQSTTRYLKNLIPRPRRRAPLEGGDSKRRASPNKHTDPPSSAISDEWSASIPRQALLGRSVSSKGSIDHQRRSRASPTARRNSLTSTFRKSFTLRASPNHALMHHEGLGPSGTPKIIVHREAGSILHEGRVFKANHNYIATRWVPRYLKLKPGVLVYAHEDGVERDIIPLTNTRVVKHKSDPLAFVLTRTTGKPIEFRAESEAERNTWVKRIVEARQVYDQRSKEQYIRGHALDIVSDDLNVLEWSDTEEAVPLKRLQNEMHKYLQSSQTSYAELSQLLGRLITISSWDNTKIKDPGLIQQAQQIRNVINLLLQVGDDIKRKQESFNDVFRRTLKLCDNERNELLSTIKTLGKENAKYEEQLDAMQHSTTSKQRSDGNVPDSLATKQSFPPFTSRGSAAVSVEAPIAAGRDEFFDADEELSQQQAANEYTIEQDTGDADQSMPLSSTSSSSLADDLVRSHPRHLSPSGLEAVVPEDPSLETAQNVIETAEVESLGLPRPSFVFRQKLPKPRTEIKISLWSFLKDCIGKDLTKIALPVGFNEPTSFLQRLAEDYQYAWLLEKGALATDSAEALLYVAIYTTTPFASAVGRTYKPFNPMLGETYELRHRGYQLLAEQVGHHPPTSAYAVLGKGFDAWGHLTAYTKFTGKSLEVSLQGASNIRLNERSMFTFQRARMIVNNLIFGKISMDVAGTYTVTNHTTGDYALIDFPRKSGWFRNEEAHQVYGMVCERSGLLRFVFHGTWSNEIYAFRPTEEIYYTATPQAPELLDPIIKYEAKAIDFEVNWPWLMGIVEHKTLIWKADVRPAHSAQYYAFGKMTFELNELNELYDPRFGAAIAPTDSRFRPDQRALEWGEVDESNREKCRLEEKQRAFMRTLPRGERDYEPIWFHQYMDPVLNIPAYKFKGEYWNCKQLKSPEEISAFFARCPDIF